MGQTDKTHPAITDAGADVQQIVEKYDSESRYRKLSGLSGKLVFAWLVCMGLFQLYTAGLKVFPSAIQNAIHLSFVISAVFLLYPCSRKASRKSLPWHDIIFAFLAWAVSAYIAYAFKDIALRGGAPYPYEIIMGGIAVALILEAGRRIVGPVLPALAILFMGYCFFGRYAPGVFTIRGYSLERVVQHMYLTPEGVFGSALGASATFIAAFIIFGSFLNKSGGVNLFNGLSLALAGRSPGGPAKVAVLASGLLGTINGSSVANVATTGTFTIPLMKRAGYSPEYAGAIEACASTGGQLMPPIMGAGAFIMSEFLGIPYLEIVAAALIPASVYYIAIFITVHFHAKKQGMTGMDEKLLPKLRDVLKRDGHLLIPLIIVIGTLLLRYSPLKSAFTGICAIIIVSSLKRHTRMGIKGILTALGEGARDALGVAMACAVVGFLIGTVSLTSLGITLSNNIVELSGGSMFLTLVMSMVACLGLGIGLPTTANYIVCSTIVAPALIGFGILPLASHMFVFYFGIMADLSPPVCLAVFTGAGIAGGNTMKTSMAALRMVLVTFLMPFAFVYDNAILGLGVPWWQAALTGLACVIGAWSVAAALERWLFSPFSKPPAALFFVLGVAVYYPLPELRAALCFLICLFSFVCFLRRGKTRYAGGNASA
ncbi:C4-dicarboxylate ABC transporter [Deltaproteobacteria bacterium]|nr:C4-dicarboxylate ABC transporter [Deltaproteobacteria bacterium]